MLKSVLAALFVAVVSTGAVAQEFQFEAPPLFDNCGDPSLAKAKTEGVTLGFSPSPPYSSLDPATKQATGLDVELVEAALKWAGVTKFKYEVMPFGQLIPALLAKRIDVVAANIHVTPDRLKAVSFTGPAWWYGPAIVVAKGNPAGITSFDTLKGKKIGAIAGSAADEYLRKIGVAVTAFQTDAEEFSAISTGRVDAILEDDVKVIEFMKANAASPIEIVQNVAIPDELIFKFGYGYARYALRKEDCSLRSAFTQGLAEVRGNGQASSILKKYGLTNRNMFFFPL
ncbi:extracellular solute-binding protein family 3 [Ancylobacter novellus DSM 506]|uniref:Extracellular solute-binding protein family 3 n=1 Tax=Ancylobacter novellus (strain ATCC 8093 / DSM 506 / JCM 20403 / CCM 1077 / IAM 12100 / NBRC 12443 / NCIMB 10456) TaxID=639283 RepID=D7A0P1_ANCN5|nr:transporter substrate-binding domain-containing protein [Ancylobacter novellus]ADH91362.1 extracellular solute-binding protein family 3 [Ancylobacter novellus DSM 506]